MVIWEQLIHLGDLSGMGTKFEDLDKMEHPVFRLPKSRCQLLGIILFIYLAASGLSCGLQDAGFFIVAWASL